MGLIEKLYFIKRSNREQFQEIYKLAYMDTLTGVYNRNYYNYSSKFTYSIDECYVLFVDIDGLKKVNDELGHAEGDDLIRSVANQLKKLTGAREICRLGGDEFIVIFDTEFDYYEFTKLEDCSWGFMKKGLNESLSSAVAKSDAQMYISKNNKKNKIGFVGGVVNE